MTIQQKRFIELADIISLRFECKNCPTALQIGLDKLKSGTLHSCPNCKSDWALMKNGMASNNAEAQFARFIDVLKDTESLCGNAPIGFNLSLEIKDSPEN